MSYTDHDRHHRSRHEAYTPRTRDRDPYSPRYAQSPAPIEKPTMRGNMNGYASSYYNPRDSYDTYDTYSTYNSYTTREPRRSAAPPRHRRSARKPTWPPSPAVEDESDAAQKEVPSVVGSDEGEPPINTRGSVDQESLLDEIEQPKQSAGDDPRFNNTSEASDNGLNTTPNGHEARRRSVAERGNMPHLNTHVDTDPIMFAKRVSTPYSYTPQKDSHAPASANFMLSPEPMTPAGTSRHGTTTSRDDREAQRDQNARPSRTVPGHARRDSFDRSAPRPARNAVFDDDTASEGEDMAHLRINERKPARYSFVKSDSQKEDSRADLHKSQPRSEPPRQDSKQRSPARSAYEYPSRPVKESSYNQSPRSSASSVNSEKRRSRPNPVDTAYANSPRDPSRPSSPIHRVPSPKLPPRLRESPPASRPSSRGNAAKPQSPLAWSTTFQPPSPRQVPITDADWHSTYPPTNAYDRSRPPSRLSRHETIQVPLPRVDIQSPSPVRPANPLPYPVEDHHAAVWMPPEEHYQFDHSSVSSPRQQQVFRDVPRVASPSIPSSPRQSDVYREVRSARPRTPRADEALRPRRSRSNSADSKHSLDSSRTKHSSTTSRAKAQTLIERPLPACPRSAPTDRHDDWYSFPGYRNFDVCPACFDAVFVDTPFAGCFKQMRRYERPTERFCDFSSPWVRLAWLLTIKQRRADLGLLYALADVNDTERPCPAHRELSADRVAWYGLLDPREGVHVAGFAVCAADVKNLEILFPSVKGYFTPLPSSIYATPEKHTCSLRTASTRFLAYLDLLVDLDAEAQSTATHANISPFLKLARANAFKGECARNKPLHRKPWHFIPSLPEFTVCEECFAEVIWPAVAAQSSALAQRVNKSIQLVPNEDPEVGSSCVLYSKRMRRVWDVSCAEEDIKYLERKVLERRRKEVLLGRERRGVLAWMGGVEKGGRQWERAREELRLLEREWGEWE